MRPHQSKAAGYKFINGPSTASTGQITPNQTALSLGVAARDILILPLECRQSSQMFCGQELRMKAPIGKMGNFD